MWTRQELIDTARSLRDARVLSVYLDGTARDPAARDLWRTQLDHALERERAHISDPAEHRAFDQAAALLRDTIASATGALGTPGWMAFVTPQNVRLRATLPAPTPLRVHWGRGALVAPALRALAEMRPAIVAIVDSRSARLFRYGDGALEPLETLRAHTPMDPVSHMGTPPRQGFHSGTRGRTGTDAAERERRAGREHMMRELASRMLTLAGSGGWLILGGTVEAAHEASAALPESAASRALLLRELHLQASDSEIARHAAEGASALRRREEAAAVRTLLERATGGGRAAMGIAPVQRALEAGAVQRLFLTVRFIDERPVPADALARAAFDEGADVEAVSGDGAELLDAEAEGIGALLRFTPSARPRAAERPGREAVDADHRRGA